MKSYWEKIQLISIFGMVLLGILGYYPMILMTPVAAIPIAFSPPPPPPDRGAAGDRGGAASRGCGVSNQSIIALVPVYKETLKPGQTEVVSVTKVWGLTTEEYPSFWFFVPYQKSAINSIEFVLQDESSKPSQTLSRTTVTIPEVPGIISIRLNPTTPPLQVDKMYHWFFKMKIICNPQQPPEWKYVEGWVQRVNLYAKNSIWYDALTTLAELRLAKPKDPTLAVEWMNLLKSVDLENLAKQPLIKCCQTNAKQQK
ncbi:DUF928 domain-containing protein [Nostoc sp.]|uniref:DUF928 domain-containing protein n=1 Tax=Nostoc sp. TaxID=1180 RepID=UPI002FF9B72F